MAKTKIKCDVLAIDLSSLIFRSFYALPTSIKDVDGNPVNGIKGYLETTNRLKETYNPKLIVHALDADWRPIWRTKLVPEYKAHRVVSDNEEEIDEDLNRQIDILPKILELLGMPCVSKSNYEADDVLASIAKSNRNCIVVTGDRDLFQVIDASRNVFVHLLGKDGGILFDEKVLQNKYGIEAKSYLDFSVLKGDPSDGLPGVKGVGEKTAKNLISKFISIENLIKNYSYSSDLSDKQKSNFKDSLNYLQNAKKVVKLRNDLRITINKPKYIEVDKVLNSLKKYRIDKQIKHFY